MKNGRPWHLGREDFFRRYFSGQPVSVAAMAVGASPSTGRAWVREVAGRGYIKAVSTSDTSSASRYLKTSERIVIADLHREGASAAAIARRLGRHRSTVIRELARNRDEDGRYRPYRAQAQAQLRRPRPKTAKLVSHPHLASWVQDGLSRRWSPQQISRRLVRDFPDDLEMRVCHETIYQSLYLQARGGLRREVQTALRTGRAMRRPKGQQRTPRQFGESMLMISQRPAEVEDRAVPGHWEGDLILGARNGSAIATLVERHTRFVMLCHLPGRHDAISVAQALVARMTTLPPHLRASLTWDQGSEMAAHHQISIAADLPIYFCDPASPWQRGSNENTNGLLRQYFPKGTDLRAHGPEDLEHVANELNARPRQTLNWHTPAERMRALLTAS